MRSLMCLLFLVLFCCVQMTSSALHSIDAAQSKCCGEFSNVKIPVKLVTSYSWTSSSCPRRAIVFKTKAGKEFCIDPETTWVSGHVAKVDKRTKTATETNFTTTTATESNATSTTNATKTTATESTSAASTTATTAKTQSLPV